MNDLTIPFNAEALDTYGQPQPLRRKRLGYEFRKRTVGALYDELLNSPCDIDDVTAMSHPQTLASVSRECHRLLVALEDADWLGYDNGYGLLNDIRDGLLGNIDARDHLVVSAFYRFGRSVMAGGVR
jgi:hypothetical protein